MGQRNVGGSRCSIGRGDAGDNLDCNTSSFSVFGLFSAAPENQRVAALEANDIAALARFCNQQRIDLVLGQGVARALLRNRDQPRIWAGHREDRRINQPVVNDKFSLLNQPSSTKSQQVRITRPCANKINSACFCHAARYRRAQH